MNLLSKVNLPVLALAFMLMPITVFGQSNGHYDFDLTNQNTTYSINIEEGDSQNSTFVKGVIKGENKSGDYINLKLIRLGQPITRTHTFDFIKNGTENSSRIQLRLNDVYYSVLMGQINEELSGNQLTVKFNVKASPFDETMDFIKGKKNPSKLKEIRGVLKVNIEIVCMKMEEINRDNGTSSHYPLPEGKMPLWCSKML